ncbi:hypothetical protein EYF80_033543 [Liparis tanakae]|uniref:Uncharacterized protein n=1 Tax=Liparis tanakae TaxID=230148 RepID=A0A4Z2GSN0_9TELE|nr:hypothetical protein EYF80_033543 [Liparis tanakae]
MSTAVATGEMAPGFFYCQKESERPSRPWATCNGFMRDKSEEFVSQQINAKGSNGAHIYPRVGQTEEAQ